MIRTVVIDPIEPAPLSLRHALGVNLDLQLKLLSQANTPVDPTSLLPQLVLLARSQNLLGAYDVATLDAAGGVGSVSIPGAALTDQVGYTVELYQRQENIVPGDPALPVRLLASGVMLLQGGAYEAMGPLGMINVPVVTGPQGPQGIQGVPGPVGPVSTVPGPVGPAGPANVLTIGTVITGPPGSMASVSISGTSPNQVLDFVIPQGLTGDPGATGATGATGSNITLGTALPGSALDGALFWNTTTNTLYVREAGAWQVVEATWG